MGTTMVVTSLEVMRTGMVGERMTEPRAAMVIAGAASMIGLRPTASASRPKEFDRSTSMSAEVEPRRPRRRAMAAGARPDARSAGASAVPMHPKHADCRPATTMRSATGGGSGRAAGGGRGV